MRSLAVAAAALALGYAAAGHAQCSFAWSCKGNTGCMSVMQRPNGVASGAPDMAACNAARRKWASMGVPPTSQCTCTGGAGGAASGSFSAANPFAAGQAIIANAHQQAQGAARANQNFSAGLSEQQAQLLDAAEQEKWRQYKAEEERNRRKREDLLASLTRGIGNTELGARGSSETIDLRAGTSFFGRPSNPTGTMTTVVPGATIELPEPPKAAPASKPADPTAREKAEEAWNKALEEKERAEELQRRLEAEKKEAERRRAEAEKKYQEQQARVQTVPPEQADKRKQEDDKLAEAEKLLKEATELDQKASEELDKAEKGVREAAKRAASADQARSQFAAPPPQSAQPGSQ